MGVIGQRPTEAGEPRGLRRFARPGLVVAAVLIVGLLLALVLAGPRSRLLGELPPELRRLLSRLSNEPSEAERGPFPSPRELELAKQPGVYRLNALRAAPEAALAGARDRTPPVPPPAGELELVQFAAPLGDHPAYVSAVAAGARRPAVVWLGGGAHFGLSERVWQTQGPGQTQAPDLSARALRAAGIVTMYPALRGASFSPGHPECFLGEVDDVIAAADYLAQRPDVDERRIYLGGHDTGATLALLVAASTSRFRGVLALGPVGDVLEYDDSCVPEGASDAVRHPRQPFRFLHEIEAPTYVVEGARAATARAFPILERYVGAAPVRFLTIEGADHESVVAAGAAALAQAIAEDAGERPALSLDRAAIEARLASP